MSICDYIISKMNQLQLGRLRQVMVGSSAVSALRRLLSSQRSSGGGSGAQAAQQAARPRMKLPELSADSDAYKVGPKPCISSLIPDLTGINYQL